MDCLFAVGLEKAFIGIGRQFSREIAVYDYDKVIALLLEQGMSPEDANEFFEFNIVGAWVGELTPVFLTKSTWEELQND